MSKEMLVILLGAWTVVLTQLGLPYRPWGLLLYACTGVAVAVTGFLLRGEALGRNSTGETLSRRSQGEAPSHARPQDTHEHKDGIGSLN